MYFESFCAESIVNQHMQDLAAPCQDRQRSHILLFPQSPQHLCVDDWHVLSVVAVWVVDPTIPQFGSTNLIRADLEATTTTWVLDGSPVATQNLAIRAWSPAQQAYEANGFAYINGTLLPPGALTVGTHTFTMTLNDPGWPTPPITQTFYVDPSGSQACTQS